MQIVFLYHNDDAASVVNDWSDAMDIFAERSDRIDCAIERCGTFLAVHDFDDLDAMFDEHLDEVVWDRKHNQSLAVHDFDDLDAMFDEHLDEVVWDRKHNQSLAVA